MGFQPGVIQKHHTNGVMCSLLRLQEEPNDCDKANKKRFQLINTLASANRQDSYNSLVSAISRLRIKIYSAFSFSHMDIVLKEKCQWKAIKECLIQSYRFAISSFVVKKLALKSTPDAINYLSKRHLFTLVKRDAAIEKIHAENLKAFVARTNEVAIREEVKTSNPEFLLNKEILFVHMTHRYNSAKVAETILSPKKPTRVGQGETIASPAPASVTPSRPAVSTPSRIAQTPIKKEGSSDGASSFAPAPFSPSVSTSQAAQPRERLREWNTPAWKAYKQAKLEAKNERAAPAFQISQSSPLWSPRTRKAREERALEAKKLVSQVSIKESGRQIIIAIPLAKSKSVERQKERDVANRLAACGGVVKANKGVIGDFFNPAARKAKLSQQLAKVCGDAFKSHRDAIAKMLSGKSKSPQKSPHSTPRTPRPPRTPLNPQVQASLSTPVGISTPFSIPTPPPFGSPLGLSHTPAKKTSLATPLSTRLTSIAETPKREPRSEPMARVLRFNDENAEPASA